MKKEKGNIIIWLIVVVIIVWGAFALFGEKAEADKIKLGFIGPLTGDAAKIGEQAKAAVEIAVEEINSEGGVNGKEIEVIYEDGMCDGKTANNAAQKLINIDKVTAIIGGTCSAETSAFTDLAEQNKVVVLSYCSSAPAITNAGDYIFRNYPSDAYQSVFAANYIFNELGYGKVAILYTNDDWGVGLQDAFEKAFTNLGGKIIAKESFTKDARDLRTQLAKIKTSNPDLLYFLGFSEASIPGLKQIKEISLKVPVFGGDAWDDPKIFSEAGNAAEGILFTSIASKEDQEYKNKIMQKLGVDETTICGPQAYDAVYILGDIMKRVGANSVDIKDELYQIKYEGGISVDVTDFDENGDLTSANYQVNQVKAGKKEVVYTPKAMMKENGDAMMEEGAMKENDAMMKKEGEMMEKDSGVMMEKKGEE